MKGIIFTTLSDMVEEKYGLATWQSLLDKTKPENEGAYTAGGTYSDVELSSLIHELSQEIKVDVSELMESFGEYMFPVLAQKYTYFIPEGTNLKDFLKSIDSIIHIEVRKLVPDSQLPEIQYIDPCTDELIMLYRSPRKLCHLAVGLTKGAAKYFNENIQIKQTKCMHNGEDHCRLEVTFLTGADGERT